MKKFKKNKLDIKLRINIEMPRYNCGSVNRVSTYPCGKVTSMAVRDSIKMKQLHMKVCVECQSYDITDVRIDRITASNGMTINNRGALVKQLTSEQLSKQLHNEKKLE
jgi:hypothetical protein